MVLVISCSDAPKIYHTHSLYDVQALRSSEAFHLHLLRYSWRAGATQHFWCIGKFVDGCSCLSIARGIECFHLTATAAQKEPSAYAGHMSGCRGCLLLRACAGHQGSGRRNGASATDRVLVEEAQRFGAAGRRNLQHQVMHDSPVTRQRQLRPETQRQVQKPAADRLNLSGHQQKSLLRILCLPRISWPVLRMPLVVQSTGKLHSHGASRSMPHTVLVVRQQQSLLRPARRLGGRLGPQEAPPPGHHC